MSVVGDYLRTMIAERPYRYRVADVAEAFAGHNVIIGGNFDTNPWQRGTSFPAIASSSYSADRWKFGNSTAAVVTISKAADAPDPSLTGIFGSNSLKIAVTTADATIAASDQASINQNIEGYNWAPLAQNPTVLVFCVKAHRAGTYCVSFVNSTADRSYVAEYTVNASDTWELKTIKVPASPSGGTWNYTTGVGLGIRFALAVGSTYQTTADEWASGNYLGTSNQVNGVGATTDTFQIDFVDFRRGTVATPWENRSVGEELFLAERYYSKYSPGFNQPVGSGVWTSTTAARISYPFNMPMRTTPTITITGPAHFSAFTSGGAIAPSAISAAGVYASGCELDVTVASGATAGGGCYLAGNTTGGIIERSAEL